GGLLLRLLIGLLLLTSPFLEWLAATLRRWITGVNRSQPPLEGVFGDSTASTTVLGELVRNFAVVRYCLVMGIVLLVLGLFWLFFVRRSQSVRSDESEESAQERIGLGELGDLWSRLRAWAALTRRYGLGSGLLAAISVQNIYANVSRLARQRGYPRPPAQPPDDYLALLGQAFPGQDQPLARLTEAYMRVHYGDHPVAEGELDQLRADYALIRETARLATTTDKR
ncbi:MAG: DUF4129 domain-containing protein, partial [Chloroflexota bacterium]|nr:DUF4129 domain-containing protein [Chloroflexota bacterium]